MLSPSTRCSQTTPRWQTLTTLPADHRPPAFLRSWLLNDTSLTARLIAFSEGAFDVEILRQKHGIPTREEQQALNMPRPAQALIREVILRGHRQPWVFARSVLPLSSLTGRLRRLRKQDRQPLGKFLFKHPDLERSPVVIAAFAPGDGYLPTDLQSPGCLWGRRSIFRLDGKPLLISEVFLDAFNRTAEARPLAKTSPARTSMAK